VTEQRLLDALSLFQKWTETSSVYYDDELGVTHERTDDALFLSTDFADNTTYCVSMYEGVAEVTVKRTDNYKLPHEHQKYGDGEMEDQDWSYLQTLLARLLTEFTGLEALQDTDVKPLWAELQASLHACPFPAASNQRLPSLRKNPSHLAHLLCGNLKKSKRLAEWEWKEWADSGVSAINKLGASKILGIKLSYPDVATRERIRQSDDFSNEVLAWFDDQLSPYLVTLIALSPIDEHQRFGLVPVASLSALEHILGRLCIVFRGVSSAGE
jgi:hypothetical protein